MNPQDDRGNDNAKPNGRPTGRKFAEWVTLGFSAVLVLAVAGVLLRGALRDPPEFVLVDVRVLSEEAQERQGKYVVPVEVRNAGRRTLKDLTVLVSYQSPGGEQETGEIKLDYLGEHASQKVYLYFDRHPRELKVEARPFDYQLE